ncbi:hypothetical protein FE257_000956 [Aspergillus nanangensis]|uniref:Fungal STAND N-terminal Goodbye domain-containing protein n=1 Tax=Aspergillus nanangensis TaxID=2582783 RepID=A0AAD4CEC2_ASPNN|nr:hypothetical protein FE257_000956 [Aspergillus nanangensis]
MAAPNQIPSIYAQAIAKYQETTKDLSLDASFLTKLQTVEDLTQELDERNRGFGEFRHKRGALFNGLEMALRPIQLFGNLAAGGASMAFPPSSLIFGAVTYLIGAAKGVSASYDAIQDLMGTLKDFTIRLKAYNREQISSDLSHKLSDILVTLLEVFALSTKTIRRGRLLKFTRNVLLGSDDAIQAAMGKLDKLTKVEAQLVGAETLTESKRTGRVVDDVSVTVHETNTAMNQMTVRVNELHEMLGNLQVSREEAAEQVAERAHDAVRGVLRPSKGDVAQDRYEKISKARLQGTGDWVRGEEVFKGWVERESPVIFVSGNPGSGKSYLSANMIQFLQEEGLQGSEGNAQASVAYFFFKDDNPDTRSFHQALRDLAYQISKMDPVYEKYLATIDDYAAIGTLESAWRNLFARFFIDKANTASDVYIVLDGVDEAFPEEREVFLGLVQDLYDAQECGPVPLHIAFVGRPHLTDQFLEALETDVPTIHVTSQKNPADIEHYIKSSMKRSVIMRKVSARMRLEIFEKLSAGAEGMFLWVNLMMQELMKKRTESSMRKCLEEAPKGLKDMLRHVFWSFSVSCTEEEAEYLNEMLLWTVCSEKPLELGHVEALLRLGSSEGDGMIDLEGTIRKQFAALFTLDRLDGLTTAELKSRTTNIDADDIGLGDDIVGDDSDLGLDGEEVENMGDFDSDKSTTMMAFSHASIGDFLRDKQEGKISGGEGHIPVGVDMTQALSHVLRTFLKNLTDQEFLEKSGDARTMSTFTLDSWMQHLRSTSPSNGPLTTRTEIASMLVTMFTDEDTMYRWVDCVDWASTQENLDAVRKWWNDPEVVASLTPQQQAFVTSTQSDTKRTFEPLAKFCAKRWLCEDYWHPISASAMVWSYVQFVQGNEVNIAKEYSVTEEDIIHAAEFGGTEKDACWYRRCAYVLREKGYYDLAQEYLSKSIEMDPENRKTKVGLAMTYTRSQQWDKALELHLELQQDVARKMEEDPDMADSLMPELHRTQEEIAECYSQLGQGDTQFDVLKTAIISHPSCDACIKALVSHQHARGLFQDMMQMLENMANETVAGKDYSLLTESMWLNAYHWMSYFQHTAEAAVATDRLDFLIEQWQVSSRTGKRIGLLLSSAYIEMSLAKIYTVYVKDEQEAITHWENIVYQFASAKDSGLLRMVKNVAASELATLLLCSAINAGVGTAKADEIVTRLENMGEGVGGNKTSGNDSISRARSVSLGVYYRLTGRHTEATDLFRPSVKRCIDILSDDDPENDLRGLFDLLEALVAAGDTQNAISVAYIIGKYPGDADSDETAEDHVAWQCDGVCQKELPVLDGLSICSVCLDMGFCADCLEILQRDAGEISNCSAKHVEHFLYVPSRPRNPGLDAVVYEENVMSFADWMKKLRKIWRL